MPDKKKKKNLVLKILKFFNANRCSKSSARSRRHTPCHARANSECLWHSLVCALYCSGTLIRSFALAHSQARSNVAVGRAHQAVSFFLFFCVCVRLCVSLAHSRKAVFCARKCLCKCIVMLMRIALSRLHYAHLLDNNKNVSLSERTRNKRFFFFFFFFFALLLCVCVCAFVWLLAAHQRLFFRSHRW